MMNRKISIEKPENFSFRATVYSHGWSDLAPFALDESDLSLRFVFDNEHLEMPVAARISAGESSIEIEFGEDRLNEKAVSRIVADVKHILRLDDDLDEFYWLAERDEKLAWITQEKAGRLLRSPTVFEDLVKTICTTNCSWSLTKKMVSNLVEKLGKASANGEKTFPTPEAMAAVTAEFYREEIRAGYRAPYFAELAEDAAAGKLDLESWLDPEMPAAELKKRMKKIKGVGDYAAENLLKLVGKYDGLALDSWLRAQFYKKYNGNQICPDERIRRHYEKYGKWRGLFIWCEMTERWLRQPGADGSANQPAEN